MKRSRATMMILPLVVGLLVASAVTLDRNCPSSGLALTHGRRAVHRLKNRTSIPQPTDFDSQVTLQTMLQTGHDETRWNQARAARIEGYVVSVGRAGIELANCYSPRRRDIHINLALRTDAPESEQLVVEVTPHFERWARNQGLDWSAETLKRTLVGRWCRLEGWLFYDREHAKESGNTFEEGEDLWRATAWEIHPVTTIEVVR